MPKKEIKIKIEDESNNELNGYHNCSDSNCVSVSSTGDHQDWTTTHTMPAPDNDDNPYNKLKCVCGSKHGSWSECDEHFCDGPENDDDDKEGYAFAYPDNGYTYDDEVDDPTPICGYDIYDDKDINIEMDDIHKFNIGNSDYSKHKIQPWDIWEEYELNPWEADIVKRVLRKKYEPGMSYVDSRIMDFNKIIHVARKCIEMLEKQKQNQPLAF